MVINTRFSVGDHVIYRDGMEIYEVKIEKITIIATGKYLHSTKYEFDNGMHCFEGIYPDWDKRMFENKYYFERWYNEFGGIKYVNEDDVNDVLKLIRGNNLLETDEWKGDVNE